MFGAGLAFFGKLEPFSFNAFFEGLFKFHKVFQKGPVDTFDQSMFKSLIDYFKENSSAQKNLRELKYKVYISLI